MAITTQLFQNLACGASTGGGLPHPPPDPPPPHQGGDFVTPLKYLFSEHYSRLAASGPASSPSRGQRPGEGALLKLSGKMRLRRSSSRRHGRHSAARQSGAIGRQSGAEDVAEDHHADDEMPLLEDGGETDDDEMLEEKLTTMCFSMSPVRLSSARSCALFSFMLHLRFNLEVHYIRIVCTRPALSLNCNQ